MKWLNKESIKFDSTNKIGIEHVWYIPSDLQDKRYGHMFWTLGTVCDILKEKSRYITSEIQWNFKIKGW